MPNKSKGKKEIEKYSGGKYGMGVVIGTTLTAGKYLHDATLTSLQLRYFDYFFNKSNA